MRNDKEVCIFGTSSIEIHKQQDAENREYFWMPNEFDQPIKTLDKMFKIIILGKIKVHDKYNATHVTNKSWCIITSSSK